MIRSNSIAYFRKRIQCLNLKVPLLHQPKLLIILILFTLFATHPAFAQLGGTGAGSFPAERLRPAMDTLGILDVDTGSVGTHFDADGALWLGYAYNPLIVYRRTPDDRLERAAGVITHRLGGNLVGAISLFNWVQLGVDLPVVLAQTGESGKIGQPGLTPGGGLDIVGLGDLRITPKIRILRGKEHAVDLALMLAFTLPTGFPFQQYMGEGFLTAIPEFAISKNFGELDERIDGFRLAGNFGYRARAHSEFYGAIIGHELTYRMGAAYDLAPRWKVPLELSTSVDGAIGVWPFITSTAQAPLEAKLGVAYQVWGPLTLFAGAGAGIIAGVAVPDARIFGGIRFTQRQHDKDGDGVRDGDDRCPEDPEDKDGFEDHDGCIDRDNDQDQILDEQDQCPDEAEDKDGFEDDDGCPDRDNDKDGVPDDKDACPDDAEDKDGFEDEDGCPDLDDDKDGVPDALDACKNEPGLPEYDGCGPPADTDGDGIPDERDMCPKKAEDIDNWKDADGCPEPDNDEDGILDTDDKCPDAAEDKDGFEDEDGCADPDNDKDGILDEDDQCPNEPETINGNKDDDGCPDKGKTKVIISKKKIEILEKVYFDTGKSDIQSRSYNLLDQVASILRNNKWIEHIRIEGHTDDRGSAISNLKLSQERASAVRSYLISKGIAKERLVAKGFGEDKPIKSNRTRRGREANRRVTFNITDGASDDVEIKNSNEERSAP